LLGKLKFRNDKRQGALQPFRGTRLITTHPNSAEMLEPRPLPFRDSRRNLPEVAVEADENGLQFLRYGSNHAYPVDTHRPQMLSEIITGDCRHDLAARAPFDMLIADPPYGETSFYWDRHCEGWIEAAAPLMKATGSL
jgi:hypothetical protein